MPRSIQTEGAAKQAPSVYYSKILIFIDEAFPYLLRYSDINGNNIASISKNTRRETIKKIVLS